MVVSKKFPALPVRQILGFALIALMPGFAEEVVFRGIAVQAFPPKGITRAAVYSAAIFGALHLVNLLRGADPLATLVQVIFDAMFGFVAAAPRLYTGALWPIILIHAA